MAYTYVIGVCLKKPWMKNSDGREKKLLECPKTKKIIGRVGVVIVMILTWYLAAMIWRIFFKSANGKTSFLCCCPKWLWLVFGQQNIQIWLFVFDLYICLFVCLCLTRAFHRREIFVLVLFFRKRKYQFLPSHIEFYLAIYNLRLLLIMGFGPVGGGGEGAGVCTRGQQVGGG